MLDRLESPHMEMLANTNSDSELPRSEIAPAIHIGFLDNNAIHAISPLLDKRIPVVKAVYLYEPIMAPKLSAFTKVASEHNIEVSFIEIKPASVTERQQQLHSVLAKLTIDKQSHYYFNLSCGNRWQVLAAHTFALRHKINCYLIDVQTDELSWLTLEQEKTLNVSDTICLRNFFRAYGSEINNQQESVDYLSAKCMPTLKKWLKGAKTFQHGFGLLNKVTMSTDSANISKPLTRYLNKEPVFRRLINDLNKLGWAQLDNKNRLHFRHHELKKIIAGGWLEYITFALIGQLKETVTTIQDVSWGVEVVRNQETLENELDVALLANNKLHILECKTKTFPSGEVKSIIYQLDALAEILGGFSARGALVTLKPVSHNDWLRANELGVKIFGPEQLPDLKRHLSNWIKRA